MAAIALPDVDRRKLERVLDRLTPLTALDLSDIELPGLEHVGRRAQRAFDRATGRSRTSIWPRLALGVGLLALVGLAVFVLGSSRRGMWGSSVSDETDEMDLAGPDRPFDEPPADLAAITVNAPAGSSRMEASEPDAARSETGLTAAEASLTSRDPAEETL